MINTLEKRINIYYKEYKSEKYRNSKLNASIYVIDYSKIIDFKFKEFSNFKDAVKFALMGNKRKILYLGNEVEYSRLNNKTAYYLDNKKEKMVIIGGI